jgi:phage gp36-like protein
MATQQLLTLTEFGNLGVAASAFPTSITDTVKTAQIVAASGVVAGYVGKRFTFPLAQWGDDIRSAVAAIATFTLLKLRGFNPENPADQLVVKAYDDAIAWCRDVAKGLVEPSDIIDATPTEDDAAPLVLSDAIAGWSLPSTVTAEEDGL